jgi:uncharacterized protein
MGQQIASIGGARKTAGESRANTMTGVESELQIVESSIGRHLFVVDGSRIYDLPDDVTVALDALLAEIAPADRRRIDERPLAPPPLQSLSLNLAQACNMGCSYCYADEGKFGGPSRVMPLEIAQAAVDRLIAEAAPRADLLVGFMGGEPFLRRAVMREIVPYALSRARAARRTVRFSITTNATLLTDDDVRFLSDHDFQIAISIDGPKALNDAQRPLNGGGSAYDRVVAALEKFDRLGRPRHLSARATVTPGGGPLMATLDHLIGLGFDSVGFSPVLVSPDPRRAFVAADFTRFRDDMIACGAKAKAAILQRRRYPFSNFETALHEIHRGSHRPYPCGAGAAYLSVDVDGGLYACHRLVDDQRFAMGDVRSGSDIGQRAAHLAERHVDRQEPCRSCWARYLCGGGCYHEVDRRGRIACDYIRDWLTFCIASYAEISAQAPGYFAAPERYYEHAARNSHSEVVL